MGGRGKGNNMGEWFTVEQIERDTYAISEYRHWEEPHCYLLLGARRALLIDSGLGVADIGRAVQELTLIHIWPSCLWLTVKSNTLSSALFPQTV